MGQYDLPPKNSQVIARTKGGIEFTEQDINDAMSLAFGFSGGGLGTKAVPKTVRVPVNMIEHGESALPGGGLSHPGSKDRIQQYAKEPIPAIEATTPDTVGGKWMVYDGSHRLEAAKLRGDEFIDVTPIGEMPKQ